MNKEVKINFKGKKVLKWIVVICFVLIITLISIPFVFKDKIVQMVTNTINNNINATVTFSEANVSLLKHFPLASITVNDITVANKAPFVGDTLYTAKELSVSMRITELFKSAADEVIELKSITTKNGHVNMIVNKENLANYQIALQHETVDEKDTSATTFSLNLEEYKLENINFKYLDRSSNIIMKLDHINHLGRGNFAKEILDLDTQTTANLSLSLDNVNYIQNIAISLNAVLGIDLKNSKYTFKENTGHINLLPLAFNGFIQLIDEGQFYDINFKTPSSSFINLLALLPKQYSGNLKAIKTVGNFDLNGIIKGVLSENRIPTFAISFLSKKALFKYDDLPTAVKNINIDAKISNKTGKVEDTYVNVNKLTFKIDEEVFSANGSIARLTTNPTIKVAAKGTLNLANIHKVYPAFKKELSGILTADITTNFDVNAIEKGNYQNIKNTGEIKVSDFKYEGTAVANPFYIKKTGITFNTKTIKLNEFTAKTGDSDVSITGSIDNFYGFLFDNQVLKGDFSLSSNRFKVSDFLSDASTAINPKAETEQLKIPAFLDCKFTAKAKSVAYDNILLKNVSGTIYIKEEAVNIKDLKSDVFGGNIGFTGRVSTKEKISKFNMDLNLKALNISESFSDLNMLKSIAPIAKTIDGKINATVNVSGDLNTDLTPDLKTISGKLLGQLLNTKLKASNSKVLSLLSDKVSFLDVNKLNLNNVTGSFSFENSVVTVKPIPLKYEDVNIEIGGTHGFDNTMKYDLYFDVPVKYLGTDVINLISKLSIKEADKVKTIPVKASLNGSFSNPSFSTNIKEATTNLITDLVKKQKERLIDESSDKIKGFLGINPKNKDSTHQGDVKDEIKDILGGLFGRKKDTTKKKN
jgi:hypothetical protein